VVVDGPRVYFSRVERDPPLRIRPWNGHRTETWNIHVVTFLCEQCPYSGRAPGNDAASARILRLSGERVGGGGLRARIAHHQKPSLRPHWHIDYLRAHTRFHGIWFSYDARRREHQWARVVRTMRDARAPLLGFGASDCNCRSHLYFFKRCPSRTRFQRALESLAKRHPPVEEFEPVNLSRVRLGREH
jgi:Uri superfamily endonuclease